MNLPRPILNEFRRLGIKLEYGYLGKTKHFHIRVLKKDYDYLDDKRWVIQFGYRPTFDRWANSTNFETEIWYSPTHQIVNDKDEIEIKKNPNNKHYTIPKLDKELEWCLMVSQSGVFNFNSYFETIKTPWFIY